VSDRAAPNDRASEDAVVGAILERPNLLPDVAAILRPEDFYFGELREIYEAALAVDSDGLAADPVAVMMELRRNGSNVDPIRVRDLYAGGVSTIGAPIPELATTYARTVVRLATQRKLRSTLLDALDEIDGDKRDPAQIAADVSAETIAATVDREVTTEPLGDLLSEALEVLEARSTKEQDPSSIQTGFLGLDQLLGGMMRGQLVLVAARPGEGKSSLAANVGRNVAGSAGPVAFFSLEMSAFEVAMRMLCTEASVAYSSVRTGRATPLDWQRLLAATERLVGLPLAIDDRPFLRVPEIRAAARRVPGLALVVVDYLQLMGSTAARGANRQEQIAEISRSLKLLAKELSVPVLACAQLSREVEKRANRRPTLADLRESGGLEQDADVVILLHPDPSHPSNHDAIVAKHRNGPTGTIRLTFRRDVTRFTDRRAD